MPNFVVGLLANLTPASAVCLAVGVFATSLVPFLLFVTAEHVTPRWLRALPARTREMTARAGLSAAALRLILTAPKGTNR